MNAVIYARYSSDNQREESIDAQVRAIKEYALKGNLTLVKIYADEAKTATTDQRPQFLQMMQDAELGLFKAVIVHKLDRFSRDRFDSAYYKRHLKNCGVRLYSVLENIDDSPESIILESVLEGMAEYYSKNLAREVMKGMRETAYQCKHTGGTPPLGYDVGPDKTYIINECEAESVRIIFEMYGSGEGYSSILDVLNNKGYKTKLGKPFGKNSLHDILKNEKYSGVFVFNRTSTKSNGKRNNRQSKPDDEIIKVPGGCPQIITDFLWKKVMKKMAANKRTTGSYSAKMTYLLSGLVYCGQCGGSMLGNKAKTGRNKTEYAYYECGTRKRKRTCSMKPINKVYLEDKVIDSLYENLFADNVIDNVTDMIYTHAASENTEIPKQIKTYEKKLAGIEIELNNIVNAIAKGMFHESMKEKMDELEAAKSTLTIRIEEAKLQYKAHALSREQIYNFLHRYKDIKNMTPAEQKNAITVFVESVTVYEDNIDIRILTTPNNGPHKEKKTISTKSDGQCFNRLDLLVEANHTQPSPNNINNVIFKMNISVPILTYRHR